MNATEKELAKLVFEAFRDFGHGEEMVQKCIDGLVRVHGFSQRQAENFVHDLHMSFLIQAKTNELRN